MSHLDITDILRPTVLFGNEFDVSAADEFIAGRMKESHRNISIQPFK